jgi:trans-aconitate 3-methyltransferase
MKLTYGQMATFYARASTALQPGGTLAIWTTGDIRAAPDMPNSAAIQAAMDYHIDVEMKDYRDKGNALVRGGYRDLDLPWSSQGKDEEDLGNDFDEGSFVRREWKITEMFLDSKKIDEKGASLKMVEMMYGTGSAVTRWREAVSTLTVPSFSSISTILRSRSPSPSSTSPLLHLISD